MKSSSTSLLENTCLNGWILFRRSLGERERYFQPIGEAVAAGAVALLAVGFALLYGFWYRPRATGAPDEAGASGTVGNGGEAVSAPPEEAIADDPLLSDEERVLRLLEREGGRMKQVDIVEATDWSNAKVSQLLSEMDDEGRIDKLRIGRENLISLPGEGPGSE